MNALKFQKSHVAKLFTAAALLVVGSSGFAATSWDSGVFDSKCTAGGTSFAFTSGTGVVGGATSGAVTTQANCAANGLSPASTMTAVSTANGATTAGATFAAAGVADWGTAGYGVLNRYEKDTTGPHATDNQYAVDGLLLNFAAAVSLTGVTIGWNGTDNNSGGTYGDSDMSLLAWTGTSTCNASGKLVASPTTSCGPSLAGTTIGSSMSGWTLVGNYANVGGSNGTTAGGTASVATTSYSSYWLVSAYSSSYSPSGTTAIDSNVDSFKLLSVAGKLCNSSNEAGVVGSSCTLKTTNVPEPGSLALVGIAMVGFVASRRRKLQAV